MAAASLMDADGRHQPEPATPAGSIGSGFDMAVGARASSANANWLRRIGNALSNRLAELDHADAPFWI